MSSFPAPSFGSFEKPSFYQSSREVRFEAERLQNIAVEIANPVSKRALAPWLLEGSTVLDIGAGADSSLGKEVAQRGCNYIAIEPNKKFVDTLRREGINAYQGDVTSVPVASESSDAVHMRFLFGWLNEEQRKSALRQAARTLKLGDQKAIAIIDYDWLMVDGPPEYMKATGIVCDTLKSFGFDYAYGSELALDLEGILDQGLSSQVAGYRAQPPVTHETTRTIRTGLPLFVEAVDSLKESLHALGDIERVDTLDEAIESLMAIDPDSEIRLPGIVTRTVVITKDTPFSGLPDYMPMLTADSYRGEDFLLDYTPTLIPGVMEVRRDSGLDEYVRRVQAAEYLKNGMLTSEAMIDENGMLCELSYPKRYLERSTLFAVIEEGKTKPVAAVRMIETEENVDSNIQLRSLPTAEHLNLSMDNRRVFSEDAEASGVFEVSAALRNSTEGGSLLDMTRAIIGLAAEARKRGFHTGLMTTQEKMYGLVKRVLGEDNFNVLEGPHTSSIVGASDSIKYVCLSVDIGTFLEGVFAHSAKGKDRPGLLRDVYAILEEYQNSHQAM